MNISNIIIPLIVLIVIIYGVIKKIDVYDSFIEGSKESIEMILNMFPCILAMILGVNIFIKSGVLENLFELIDPMIKLLKIPLEIIPMAIMRPISGTSSLAILNNLFETYGPDVLISKIASVIQSSTDTTLYVLTLYFGSIGIKKIRYALYAGLIADLVGIVSSIIIVNCFF